MQVSKLRYEWEDLELKAVWFPSKTLDQAECKAFVETLLTANAAEKRPLAYGIFAKDVLPLQMHFLLSRSIWCLVYRQGKLCGFAYNYDVGEHDGKRLVHMGLVKFYRPMGRDAVKAAYAALVIGNLLNFGPHYHSNITHVPLIADLGSQYMSDAYPHPVRQEPALKAAYTPVLEQLIQHYIVPVLGHAADMVDKRTFRIVGGMHENEPGFASAWDEVPKSTEMICNLFMKEWLNVSPGADGRLHVKDDLIQIGLADYRILGAPHNCEVVNKLKRSELDTEAMFVDETLLTRTKASA